MNLKELSKLLGLSQTTVSRALNGFPEVSEATRIKVTEAAQKHGYSPNTRAKSLATGRSMAIGHAVPVSGHREMVNPISGDFLSGASESYYRHGYDLHLTFNSHDDEEYQFRRLISRGIVDGVVIQAPLINDPRITLLTELGVPFAVHGRSSDAKEPYSWIDVNNTSAFERGTSLLLDLGHHHIGLINGHEFMDFAHRRRLGYESALRARGITPDPSIMASNEMTEGYGYRAAMDMLQSDTPPTAFMVSSIISGFGVRRAIEETGKQMGRDISVVIFNDCLSYLENDGEVPVFTSLASSVRLAGQKIGQIIVDLINAPNQGPTQILLEAELIIGRSTGPLRG